VALQAEKRSSADGALVTFGTAFRTHANAESLLPGRHGALPLLTGTALVGVGCANDSLPYGKLSTMAINGRSGDVALAVEP
jgi:hypothetical protein